MLVLARKETQQIKIGDNITITIIKIKGKQVRVGIEAPRNIRVVRNELLPLEIDEAAATFGSAGDYLQSRQAHPQTGNSTPRALPSGGQNLDAKTDDLRSVPDARFAPGNSSSKYPEPDNFSPWQAAGAACHF